MEQDEVNLLKEAIKIAVPTVGAIVAVAMSWGSMKTTLDIHTTAIADLTSAIRTQTDKTQLCANSLTAIQARQAQQEIDTHRIMRRLNIKFNDEQEYSTCPPYCGNVSKRPQMLPETQAPVTGKIEGHALFEAPQTVAETPKLPEISTY